MKTPAVLCLVIAGLGLCAFGVMQEVSSRHARELQAMQRQLAAQQAQHSLSRVASHMDQMQSGLQKIKEANAKLQALTTLETALRSEQARMEQAQQKAAFEADVRRQQAALAAEEEKRLGFTEN